MSSQFFVARAGSQARGRRLLLVCALALSACGGSTTGPSETQLNLAGTWNGTWTFVSGGATVSEAVTMTVTTIENTASGQWATPASQVAGTFAFTRTADFTGTASISQTLIIGGNCSAQTTLTGTATNNQLRFTLGTLTPVGLCQWAPNQTFTFSR